MTNTTVSIVIVKDNLPSDALTRIVREWDGVEIRQAVTRVGSKILRVEFLITGSEPAVLEFWAEWKSNWEIQLADDPLTIKTHAEFHPAA